MECNKDDALRAKEIAEKKFLAKDFSGARRFAVKAQNLNPGLEGISQMLATLDVYIASESKVNGEGNFYGILGVSPKADDESIRKQYRKLALMLHPDKNKSLGAEGAFKHVSEAWSLLADKIKKSQYDNRNANVFQQAANADPSQQSAQNGFYNFAKNATSRAKPPKGNANKKSSSSSGKQDRGTFWTVCYRCKMQYEYMRMYLNHNLICPNCHEAFLAVETTAPSNGSKKSTQSEHSQKRPNTYNGGMKQGIPTTGRNSSSNPNTGSSVTDKADSANHKDFQWSPFSKTAGPASTVQAANVVHQAYQKVRRDRQEAQAAKKEEALRRKNNSSKRPSGTPAAGQSNVSKKKKGLFDPSTSRVKHNWQSSGASTASPAEAELGSNGRVKLNVTNKFSNEKEVSLKDVSHLLMEKAKTGILKKLSEQSSATDTTSMSSREVTITKEAKERQNEEIHGSEFDVREGRDAACEQVTTETKVFANRCSSETFDYCLDNQLVECMTMDVPEPDFYNFDSNRIESCFGPNQVWAAYDDSDGMPRHYALILKVISLNPFKASIRWLNSNITSETSSPSFGTSGDPRACGHFRRGRHEIRTSVNCFSHQVSWTKGPGDTIHVYPRKGQVWALYRNWSPEWEELTEDKKYVLIEVLEDYDEEGVLAAPLIKVAGFKTLFHKHLNPREVIKIPTEEMFRFSHQISSYLLKGKEGPNAPKGCLELDPAAMPVELLGVIQDVVETEYMDNQGSTQENAVGCIGTSTTSSREDTMDVTEVIILDS